MKTILSSPIAIPALITAAMLGSLACPLAAADPKAAPPSELLEKAIYTEETRGDLDAAIAMYEKLVADAKSAEAIAARAQLRLGHAYLKKNRAVDAIAAFERVIERYPEMRELVEEARKHVPGAVTLGPIPWESGEVLHMSIKLPAGMDIGAMTYSAWLTKLQGQDVWRVGGRMFATAHSASRVFVRPGDFRPISSWWKHTLLGEVTTHYEAGVAKLVRVGSDETKSVPLDKITFDNEQAMHTMRLMPLAEGYSAALPIFSSLSGAVIPLAVEVRGIEKVKVPAGEWEAFKVELVPIGQIFWFSTDAKRYPVKFEGGGVISELISIEQRQPGAPVTFTDAELGVKLTAPADWVIHKQDPDDDKNVSSIYLLDPEAKLDGLFLKLTELSAIPQAERVSSRTWAEGHAGRMAKHLAEFAIRADSWTDVTVNGRPGVSYVADYKAGEKPMVFGGVYMLGAKYAAQFALMSAAAEFEEAKPGFEKIVASYQQQ